jgi:hypothetical protein
VLFLAAMVNYGLTDAYSINLQRALGTPVLFAATNSREELEPCAGRSQYLWLNRTKLDFNEPILQSKAMP